TNNRDTRDIPAKTSSKFLSAFREVVARAGESTVKVQCAGKQVALGAIMGPDGWVLTKASELRGVPTCVFRDGKRLEGRVIGIHEALDIALLKIDVKGLVPVEWVESKHARPCDWLASAGSGSAPVAAGVVSVATR